MKQATYHRGNRDFGTGSDMIKRIEALEAEVARLMKALTDTHHYLGLGHNAMAFNVARAALSTAPTGE